MKNPAQFSCFNKNTVQHAKDSLLKYKDLFKWRPSETVLEIGCAAGNVTEEVLFPFVDQHTEHLIATDISKEAIEYAKSHNVNKKISFEWLDVTNEQECEKYSNRFGHVFSFYCFHLIHQTDLWSNNVSKMLLPNGQLFTHMVVNKSFFNDVLMEQKSDQSKPWWKYIKDKPNQFVDYGSKPTQYIGDVLKKVGLKPEEMKCEIKCSTFSDQNDVKGTFTAMNPYSQFIPEDMKEDQMEDYINKTMKYVRKHHDGNYIYCLDVLSVLAKKI